VDRLAGDVAALTAEQRQGAGQESSAAGASSPFTLRERHEVIEVRLRGISKAVVGRATPSGRRTVAFGDDRTDEDLFRALPDTSVTVAVGCWVPGARYQVLLGLLEVRGAKPPLVSPLNAQLWPM
jgi:trehalose 6-phosphate synthase/phosphatase